MRLISLILITILLSTSAIADRVTPSDRVKQWASVWLDTTNRDDPPAYLLKPGDTLELLENVKYYYKVKLPDGQVGYVAKSYTTVISDTPQAATNGPLELHFTNVGQGDSTLIVCPNGETVLIDAGTLSGFPAEEVRSYLLDAIEPHGSDIDTLIVTHPDADHYNLLSEVLDDVPVGQAFYVGTKKTYASQTAYNWITTQPSSSRRLGFSDFDQETLPNQSMGCGDADIWILAASVNARKSPKNAKSIVVMVRYGDFEAILTGDATFDTEKVILSRYDHDWLNVDLLKLGHHGSRTTSTGQSWVDVLKPQIAIASSGIENSHGHPSKEVIDRLRNSTVSTTAHELMIGTGKRGSYKFPIIPGETESIFNTASSGTIVVRSNGTGYETSLEH